MSKVFTVGVFDLYHFGHVRLFKRAKELALKNDPDGKLIVAVQDGDSILKYKPGAKIVYSTEVRKEMVDSCKYVDNVLVYYDVDKDIQNVDFDVFIVGGDQNHAGFQRAMQWAREHGKEVVQLSRTGGISSSQLRTQDVKESVGKK
ncbi:MAG: adenylyltransferase/cytidyltransferase family protein [Opitutales bacterium]|nr:adenylyltransferase/cytidyltransferase family protein [Opitutales bacterium]